MPENTPEIVPQKSNALQTSQTNEIVEVMSPTVGKFNNQDLGASGTRLFGEVYDEEYLTKLTGTRRADIFDEMIRSDDTITMLLTARKNPILKGAWTIEPAKGDTPEEQAMYDKHAAHATHEFFDRMQKDFLEFVEEALTFIEHGYSLFERVHEMVVDPKFGKYVGFKNIGWRSQRTIEYWNLERTGKIETVFQQADGDVGAYVKMPGQWVTVFALRKHGDNYEGVSALRSLYGNWQRKNLFLKLVAIGLERYAVNTPVGKVPKGLEDSSERTKFVNMLKSISSHQQNYFTLPEGWEVEFLKNPFEVDKVIEAVKREDEGMVKSFVANHLNLGQGGSGGAYALGTDLSDQFLSIIENDAAIITRRFNKDIMREFINFNYGVQTKYPKLCVTGINDKFSKEFAEIITMLTNTKSLTTTEEGEQWLRKRLGLPELKTAEKIAVPDVQVGVDGAAGASPGAGAGVAEEAAVQQQALNGTQVTSLLEIVQLVAQGNLPRDSAKELITVAFPFISSEEAERILGTVGKGFKPEAAVVPPTAAAAAQPFNEQRVQFADAKATRSKIKEQLDQSSYDLAQAMRDSLKASVAAYTDSIVKQLKKVPRDQWRRIIREQGDLPGLNAYVVKVQQALTETAGRAIAQARNEIPGGRKIEFCEGVRSRIKLADAKELWLSLPKAVRELLMTDPWFTGELQYERLKAATLLTISGAVDETTDPEKIRKAVITNTDKMLVGAEAEGIGAELVTAATNLTSKTYNQARYEFFNTEDAKEQIVAFRFENPDPVTPLCTDLNGREFPVNDPESDKWLPPLHHNCKSFIVPILDSQRIKGEVKSLVPSKPDLGKFKTL
jgi:phage gp29-like protein/uncharacterized protein (DUF2267 family)